MQRIDVGKCIKIAQAKRDISVDQMARDMKVVKQQVYRWRQADDIKLRKVEELAEYFDMSLIEFLQLGD